jgi:D-amino peptidase
MKFYIGVDCEGPACVVGSPGGTLTDSRNFAFARLQATREADAAARACFDAGASQVVVWDNHGGSLNLDYDLLDERCDIALGVNFPHRWPGLDESFAGVLFIGYHAMDSTEDAVIAHTFSSTAHQWVKVNGEPVGELAIDAAIAGMMGVPALFCAGDDKCVAEAARCFPGIETVTTKTAYGWNAALSKHPRRAVQEIYDGVLRAVEGRSRMKPFTFAEPLEYEVRYKRIESAEAAARGATRGERVDAYTVRWKLASIRDRY